MTKRNILIPCSGFEEDQNAKYLWELILTEPREAEWSPREEKMVEEASNYGLVYPAIHEVLDESFLLTTDLGDPDSILVMQFPNYVSLKLAVIALAAAVDKLMEGDHR